MGLSRGSATRRWQRGLAQLPHSRPESVLGNTATALGTILAFWLAFTAKPDASLIIIVTYVCLISAYLMWRYLRQERWARYAGVQAVLSDAHMELSQALFLAEAANPEVDERVRRSLESLAQAFTMVVGSACRVCIARTFLDDASVERSGGLDGLMVKVWMRSTKHPGKVDVPVRVVDNSDFAEVLKSSEPFVCNDLVARFRAGHYKNSNWPQEGRDPGPVNYRATIVWPVYLDTNKPGASSVSSAREVAYLCVDTLKVGAFKEPDVDMGRAFAWALYPVLRKIMDGSKDSVGNGQQGE